LRGDIFDISHNQLSGIPAQSRRKLSRERETPRELIPSNLVVGKVVESKA
jgi:hypothetical protein